jgi:ABC-type branched-subunit amino acid transport system permease subunit
VGLLHDHHQPGSLSTFHFIDYIAMIIVGGMGTFGARLRRHFVVLLPEAIQRIINLAADPPDRLRLSPSSKLSSVFFIAVFLIFEPKGLAKIASKFGRRVAAKRGGKGVKAGTPVESSLIKSTFK